MSKRVEGRGANPGSGERSKIVHKELGNHKHVCHANAKLALIPDYQEVTNESIAQSDGAGSGSEVRSAKYRIEELR